MPAMPRVEACQWEEEPAALAWCPCARRAPRPIPTLLCAGLGLRGLSVELLSRPPGWFGGNPWGKGAGQRVSTSRGRTPRAGGSRGPQEVGSWMPTEQQHCCPPGLLHAPGWAGLQQELLQDGSCSLPQNWGALAWGRREWRDGCPQPVRLGSHLGSQKWHLSPWSSRVDEQCLSIKAISTMGSLNTSTLSLTLLTN